MKSIMRVKQSNKGIIYSIQLLTHILYRKIDFLRLSDHFKSNVMNNNLLTQITPRGRISVLIDEDGRPWFRFVDVEKLSGDLCDTHTVFGRGELKKFPIDQRNVLFVNSSGLLCFIPKRPECQPARAIIVDLIQKFTKAC